jgi:tetratricopeptide (TPR) repeat protein
MRRVGARSARGTARVLGRVKGVLRTFVTRLSSAIRVVAGAVCVTLVTLVGSAWPEHWPMSLQVVLMCLLGFLGVLFIELDRRAGRATTPRAEPSSETDELGVPRQRDPGRAVPAAPEVSEPLPVRDAFRGRTAELGDLMDRHRRTREQTDASRRPGPFTGGGPVLLPIHGKPGVGKSILAQELASRIRDDYPDGVLYANLGNAGDQVSAGEVLKSFLDALGWEEPLPDVYAQRASVFRTLTVGMRVLFILDAARDARQVRDVLPNESKCAVIITSRRDLGPGLGVPSLPLEPPGIDDAVEMFYAVARKSEPESLDCAIEIVELCGKLPLAIQAVAERVSQQDLNMGSAAFFLRDPDNRLDRLPGLGRDVRTGLETEYGLLAEDEKWAFRLLSRVESETWVPWVLCPMLDLTLEQAEDLCRRLNRAQLIDFVAKDFDTSLVRYRMHPLIKLYGQQVIRRNAALERMQEAYGEVDGPPGGELAAVAAAHARLNEAYLGVVSRVMGMLDPMYTSGLRASRHVPTGAELARLIARRPDPWIRAEYPNLRRAFHLAFRLKEWDLCWRLAIRLGGLVPEGVPPREAVEVLDAALLLARNVSGLAEVDANLAKGATLIAVERYNQAFEVLDDAYRLAARLVRERPESAAQAQRRMGQVSLRMGEAYVQVRRPRDAEQELLKAGRVFEQLDLRSEQLLVQLFSFLNVDGNMEDPFGGLETQLTDNAQFWRLLERFEERRRRRDWAGALEHLELARHQSLGDARRAANVLYRLARLYLEQMSDRDQPAKAEALQLRRRATRRAYQAVRAFMAISDDIGVVRAQCLLVRILVAAGDRVQAQQQMHEIERVFGRLDAETTPRIMPPLEARLLWAKGLLCQMEGDLAAADRHLLVAIGIFDDLGDGRASDTLTRIRTAMSRPPRTPLPRVGGDLHLRGGRQPS